MSGDRDPRLVWTDAGEPRSGRFDDVYFSAEDGLAESRAVFLRGCDLPNAWHGRDHFTVAELGFGTGLNIVALLDLWKRTRPEGARLTLFSIEAYPLGVQEARRALAQWPEVAEARDALLANWPPPTPGFHRIDLPTFDAVLDLAMGDAAWALDQWTGRADAWFLDGFAPSTNPQMWSDAVLDGIAARSAPDARLATFTVAGAVRRGLAERGFTVDKRPGHGRKRERLEGRRPGPAPGARPRPRVAVIGAGIAGASVVRALTAEGIRPVVIEAEGPGAGASGFPAALVTPRFDLGDGAIAALFAQALERAGGLYRAIPGAVVAEGVRQRPATDRDTGRFARIADQPIWPRESMTLQDDGSLAMAEALTVHPAMILGDWLQGVERLAWRIGDIRADGDGWIVTAGKGQTLRADAVVLAAGWGVSPLAQDLALSPVRGQADWVQAPSPEAEAWGGYVAPTPDGFLFGATHDRSDVGTEVRAADTQRNLASLATRSPDLAAAAVAGPGQARAAVRATTRDRLPLTGAVGDRPGLFVLGGLGSRGFCLAPLLAEHVAALILDRPSPLPRAVVERVSPARPAARTVPEP
ncbi:tRNA (5-methylaminomethyl-2-thiouridine)(34)-methyltransferase MnmD [Brevundimonas aurifodinae]|uniref:tRNA 5-methylaminomethyl-2-thiouridine biosynthesis bifunctional protein MnmC n=2 Tax=Brevundimonas TaxID=41275 RepID=A0ABV1NIV4_9CAUL|nr:MAG: FAD-dependent cmnm(5)s(2)U34 oxidoreductase [Brevundimonas sp. 12-68-7]OYX35607.1 MAG: FAD-dependent cmnm(5)s(2)U34 oxidoreductase [Brevundimonas subvibrioides]